MIFGTLKLLIWLAGFLVVTYVILSFFGYTVDWNYYNSHRIACQSAVNACQKTFVQKGLDGAKDSCKLQCLDWRQLLIKKVK